MLHMSSGVCPLLNHWNWMLSKNLYCINTILSLTKVKLLMKALGTKITVSRSDLSTLLEASRTILEDWVPVEHLCFGLPAEHFAGSDSRHGTSVSWYGTECDSNFEKMLVCPHYLGLWPLIVSAVTVWKTELDSWKMLNIYINNVRIYLPNLETIFYKGAEKLEVPYSRK